MKKLIPFLCAILWLFTSLHAQQPDAVKADKLNKDGNYKEALALYEKLIVAPESSGKKLAEQYTSAVQCLHQLNQLAGVDALLEKAVAAHPQDWQLLDAAGKSLLQLGYHYGAIIDNTFQRGNNSGTGKFVGSYDRDRVRALQLFEQALKTVPAGEEGAEFYQSFAAMLQQQESWKLQVLTDLTKLPDYDETNPYQHRWHGRHYGQDLRGAPVDANGDPVYHKLPQSWETATSDGERWRWLLAQRAKISEAWAFLTELQFAQFLRQEFDVHTIAQWSRNNDSEGDDVNAILSIHTLTDEETSAKLATGVKRFKLPEEFNFIKILQRLGQSSNKEHQCMAWSHLAGVYTDRRQLPKAAEYWQKVIDANTSQSDYAKEQRKQIVDNLCRFDASLVQTPGEGAKVGLVFRNGTQLRSRARKINFKQLLTDLKAYVSSNPEQLDHQRAQIQNIGYSILEKDKKKYLGEEVAKWETAVEPRKEHWDKRIDLATPLQTPGAYLLETTINDGNTCAVIVWIADTAIVKKPGIKEVQYYVVDSVTGAPVGKANLEFFGYRHEHIPAEKQKGKRNYNTITRNFAEFTDANGQYFWKTDNTTDDYRWLTIATTEDGRFAHLGLNSVWAADRQKDFYEATKIHVITDRPVYRPGQEMKWKAWIRRANYDAPTDKSEFADEKWTVQIHDGKG